ncbi:hypothetical protein [Nocardia asiatica]|uniref:nucleotide-binding protein n=1 Tax=Nocardia asiatica TaxID=209252 RepID=UPI003EDEADFF
MVAAPASGSGKTTVATGLVGALRRAGHRVAPFKVGPDYIDPGYHGLAAGRPGRNLDPVLVGADRVVPLYLHGAQGCDISVVEGVMGLFDGRIMIGTPDRWPRGPRRRSRRCWARPSCWWSTRVGTARVWRRCCTASPLSTAVSGWAA